MNAKKFSDALSALDGRYVEEAARYRRKHGQSFWVRWGAAAACLCLLAAGGAAGLLTTHHRRQMEQERADLLLLDSGLQVQGVIRDGKQVIDNRLN